MRLSMSFSGDTIPPVVSNCPSDLSSTTSCDTADATQVTWQEPSAIDNSGTATLQSQTHQPGQTFPMGPTDVTYIFTDPSGNTVDCSFTVTVTREGKYLF